MYRVRIKKLPNKAMGGVKTGQQTSTGALSIQPTALGGSDIDQYIGEKESEVTKTIQPVPRDKANVEVEKGEVIAGDLNGDGMLETAVAGGKRHYAGGTPLNLPDDTFIYSDTKSMKIKDPNFLAKFGKTTGSYTPAQLAKQYDVNKYRKILQDPNSDSIARKTAELMIRNYTMKLGALALAQESKKGFPQGVPMIANPYLQANGVSEEQIMPKYQSRFAEQSEEMESAEDMGEPQEEVAYDESMPTQMPNGEPIAMTPEMMQQQPMAAYGMEMGGYSMPFYPDYGYGGSLRRAAEGEEVEGVDPYEQAKTKQGNVTPTGKSNKWSARSENLDQFLTKWEKYIPGIKNMEEAQAQAAIYDWTLKNDPDQVKSMWKNYGLTAKGMKSSNLKKLSKNSSGQFDDSQLSNDALAKLKEAYVDGMFGIRQLDPKVKAEEPKKEEPKKKEVTKEEDEYIETTERPDLETLPMTPPPTVTTPEWTTPDLVNFYGAMGDKYKLRTDYPWAAPVDLVTPEVDYLDPTRDLAAQSEQANIAMQNLAQFTGPQQASARAAMIQGQGARQASDILSRYNNANVGIANQFYAQKANVENQERLQNQAIAKGLWDDTNRALASKRREKEARDQVARMAFTTGIKNAGDLALINATSDQYDIDPRTGTVVFQGGKDLQPSQARTFDTYLQYYRSQGFGPKEAIQAAKIAMGSGTGSPLDVEALLAGYKDGGVYVMGSNVFPFMFY